MVRVSQPAFTAFSALNQCSAIYTTHALLDPVFILVLVYERPEPSPLVYSRHVGGLLESRLRPVLTGDHQHDSFQTR